jgi:hypothetical protein
VAEWHQRVRELTIAAKETAEEYYGEGPYRTYITGISNAGYITRYALENDPDAPGQRLHTPLQRPRGRPACSRVRIYFPDDVLDAPMVVCSDLSNNPGGSITNSAEVIAAGVIQANELPAPLVWIEHWPKEATDGGEEGFELVVFSSYEVVESALPRGEEGLDRGCSLEETRPYNRGGVGGREGIEV